jgi:hypothetical protein
VMDREPTECGCGSVMTTSSEGHTGQIDGGSRRIQARQRSSSAGRPGEMLLAAAGSSAEAGSVEIRVPFFR